MKEATDLGYVVHFKEEVSLESLLSFARNLEGFEENYMFPKGASFINKTNNQETELSIDYEKLTVTIDPKIYNFNDHSFDIVRDVVLKLCKDFDIVIKTGLDKIELSKSDFLKGLDDHKKELARIKK